MSLDALVSWFGREDPSANVSLVALDHERPVGLVLNGLRTIMAIGGLRGAFGHRTVGRLLLMAASSPGPDAFGGYAAERSLDPSAAVDALKEAGFAVLAEKVYV